MSRSIRASNSRLIRMMAYFRVCVFVLPAEPMSMNPAMPLYFSHRREAVTRLHLHLSPSVSIEYVPSAAGTCFGFSIGYSMTLGSNSTIFPMRNAFTSLGIRGGQFCSHAVPTGQLQFKYGAGDRTCKWFTGRETGWVSQTGLGLQTWQSARCRINPISALSKKMKRMSWSGLLEFLDACQAMRASFLCWSIS